MLKPIPSRILRTTAVVMVCTGGDMYQEQTYDTYTLTRVHIQPTGEIRKTPSNTEQQLRSILFVDARHSAPKLDWMLLFQNATDAGGDIRVVVRDITYTVAAVDELRDDEDILHHWEIGLV